jgi:hypothetical protein
MAFIKGDDHYFHINKTSLIKMRWEMGSYFDTILGEFHGCRWIGGTNFASHWCPSTWDWMCVHNFNYLYHDTWQCLWYQSGMLPCFYFVFILSSFIGKKGKYVPCKHLHFIFAKRMYFDPKVDIFVHKSTSS